MSRADKILSSLVEAKRDLVIILNNSNPDMATQEKETGAWNENDTAWQDFQNSVVKWFGKEIKRRKLDKHVSVPNDSLYGEFYFTKFIPNVDTLNLLLDSEDEMDSQVQLETVYWKGKEIKRIRDFEDFVSKVFPKIADEL